ALAQVLVGGEAGVDLAAVEGDVLEQRVRRAARVYPHVHGAGEDAVAHRVVADGENRAAELAGPDGRAVGVGERDVAEETVAVASGRAVVHRRAGDVHADGALGDAVLGDAVR